MTPPRTVHARCIVGGTAEGPALCAPAISFLGDIDIRTGRIVGDLPGVKGETLKGRILVMPYTRGSAGAWRFLYQLFKFGTNPLAIITDELPDPSSVQGAILAGIPMVCAPEIGTAELAATGDHVRVEAEGDSAAIHINQGTSTRGRRAEPRRRAGQQMEGHAMKVGIAGFGTVGQEVARSLADGRIPGTELVAITSRDLDTARLAAAELGLGGVEIVPLAHLPGRCDVVVETATGAAFPDIARAVLSAGTDLICVSAGGFLAIPDLADIARRNGARVQIASGAMPGLDILRSAAEGTIRSVHLKGRIKVDAFANEPYVLAQGIDHRLTPPPEPVKVFDGTAAQAAKHFPRHMNIAVAISLAGIGFERTTIELWMDPGISGAIHQLTVEGDEIGLTMVSRNVPSKNPKTSRIVAPSILAALRARTAVIKVGS